MTSDTDYGDLPITTPEQDMFGVDGFVRSLARSVKGMRSPQGVVIALNGPWGSGKSSAINLLKHHLADAVESDEIEIVEFNPWWFRGEEALVLAFFRELYTATKPSLSDKAKSVIPKLGARLLKAGSVVSPIADAAGAGGAGSIASGVMSWLSGMIEDGESVEKLHATLSDALAGQAKRFIILIDDIDRLAPDEALAMFRLVKSVGRLPNVIYILAFDRVLAEKIVADRFPSEGPHYLEKIVQASFELPAPRETDIHGAVAAAIDAIVGGIGESRVVHFWNIFHECVAGELRTPRDATRYTNALTITWPAVEGEVDLGDFIAIEAYRLFQPTLYRAIRSNKSLLCGRGDWDRDRSKSAERLDALLLSSIAEKERYRRALVRLFPRLDAVWGNTIHSFSRQDRDRRIGSALHFDTYFRMSLDPDAVSRKELDAFLALIDDPKAIAAGLKAASQEPQRDGTTRAKALLEALINHADEIPVEKAEIFLRGVFFVTDDIDIVADNARGFDIGDNPLRVHWLLRAILKGQSSLAERSTILKNAAANAQLGWLANLSASGWEAHHPREGREPGPDDDRLFTELDAETMVQAFLRRAEEAAKAETLLDSPDALRTLFFWHRLGGEASSPRAWLTEAIEDDASLVKLARASTTHSWSQSGSDVVAKRSDRASVSGMEELLDLERFRANLTALAARLDAETPAGDAVARFLKAWENQDKYGD